MPPAKPSASIVASAIVAIIGSLVAILVFSMALLGFVLKGQNANSQLPQSLKAASFGMLGVCLGIAIYGVFTGIGLLRLKDWARFSVLVWAGITVFLSTVGILVISFVPLPAQPNLSENAIIITRWIVISIYGLPLLVGIWWLTLFNRHSVTIQFLGESPNVSSEVSPKPRGPLPITVLAWIFVVWALMSLPWFFLLPQRMPVVFFGHLVYGAPGKMIYLFSVFLYAVAGVGLLNLKRWSYDVAIAMQVVWLASGLTGWLNPGRKADLLGAMREMDNTMRFPGSAARPDVTRFASLGIYFGLGFGVIVLGLLVYCRKRFLETIALVSSSD